MNRLTFAFFFFIKIAFCFSQDWTHSSIFFDLINNVSVENGRGIAGGDDAYFSVGGNIWQDVSPSSPAILNQMQTSNYNCSYAIDENTMFIAGLQVVNSSGVIYKSTDGGQDWSTVYLGSNGAYDEILAIDFNHNGVGIACGYQTILKTTDFGDSWSVIYTSSSTDFLSVEVTSTHVFVRLQDSYMYSDDLGTTWNITPIRARFTSGPSGTLYGVFDSTGTGPCYVGKSTNNGSSWSYMNTYIDEIYDIEYLKNDTVAFVYGKYVGLWVNNNTELIEFPEVRWNYQGFQIDYDSVLNRIYTGTYAANSFVSYINVNSANYHSSAHFTSLKDSNCYNLENVFVGFTNYIDSCKWYVNNQFVSNDDTLFHSFSATGTIAIKRVVYFDGDSSSHSNSYYVSGNLSLDPITINDSYTDSVLCSTETPTFFSK